MFELLLNAVKIALSSNARESASTIIDFLIRSPDWQKEICTIEARVPIEECERISLVEDIIANKMALLSYANSSVASFRFIFGELTHNAFNHGAKNSKEKIVRIVVDISPTYIAVSVYNPRGIPVDLARWIEKGAKQLKDSEMLGGGRGLVAVKRLADVTEAIGSEGIKSIIYQDLVKITSKVKEDCVIISPSGGRSNPSYGERVIDYITSLGERKIILCLDKRLFDNLVDKGLLDKLVAPVVIDEDTVQESPPTPGAVSVIIKEIPPTWWYPDMLDFAESNKNIRIVYNEASLDGLFPTHLVFNTIDEAIKSFKT